ncbi:MAG: histone deacetylase [bacterium]
MALPIWTSRRFLAHDTGPSHPERPARLAACWTALEAAPFADQLAWREPQGGSSIPESIHPADYVMVLREACASLAPGELARLDPDTVVCNQSAELALLAASAVSEALADLHATGGRAAIVLARPPGHHAEATQAMGFCLINSIAVGARAAQDLGWQRVAIVDWDVHHGNGTEAAFEDDPDVLYISTHQYPFYPGTGAPSDSPSILNLPIRGGTGDDDYWALVESTILPALRAFAPDCILVSAGFDAHALDPLANCELSTAIYGQFTTALLAFGCPLLLLLEGGYSLEALGECVVEVAGVLV